MRTIAHTVKQGGFNRPFWMVLLTCCALSVSAQMERLPWTRVLPNDIDTIADQGDTISVQWEGPVTGAHSFGIESYVHLKLNPRVRTELPSYDAQVVVQVETTENPDHGDYDPGDNSVVLHSNDTLYFGYRRNGVSRLDSLDSLLTRSLDQGGRRSLGFNGAHRLLLTVVSVKVNTGNGYLPADLPENLYLDLRMEWGLTRDMDPAATSTLTIAPVECGPVNDLPPGPHEVHITWTTVPGAYDYHLEWTWVDDYDAVGSSTRLPYASLLHNIKSNGTRITTEHTEYRLPLLFDRGWVLFRVRAMGRDPNERPIYGEWNWDVTGPGPYPTSTVLAGCSLDVAAAHRSLFNWQLTSTYAEEGKRKEVMTYADGTLRSRQAVTRNNSLNVPIIGETVYDVIGRPALEIMPVPLVRDQGCPDLGSVSGDFQPIDFYERFNAVHDGVDNGTNSELNYQDIGAQGDCGVTSVVLDKDNGAELYYSEEHMNEPDALTGYPSFLPKSEGFPYAQTEYTRDNTGRVRRKGGVGPTFQLGQGHETKFLYGKPAQIQLDRLFGSEAGYASHYQKNVVVDANGQGSVSYVDRAGHTVATALVGDAPDALMPLDSYIDPPGVPVTTDLFCGLPSLECEQNVLQPTVPSLVFTDQFVVPAVGDYTFLYDLVVPQITDQCLEVCLHCRYTLDVRLVDQCGADIWTETRAVGEYMDGGSLRFMCIPEGPPENGMEDLLPTPLTHTIPNVPPGEYVLVKTLTLDTEGLDAYLAEFTANPDDYISDDCVTPYQDLLNQYLAAVDLAGCDIGCAACYDAVGPLNDFLAAGGSEAAYNDLLQQCDDQCKEKSWCEVAYLNMLTDMGISGQYAQFELNGGVATVTDRTSVFWMTPGWSLLGQRFIGNPDVNLAKRLWRQPKFLENGVYLAEYRDQNGLRTPINVVEVNPGDYEPPLIAGAPVIDNGAGDLHSFPEFLADLSDFVLAFQPGWERSLVYYHPEYCYWLECRNYGEQLSSEGLTDDKWDTSDEFDGLLINMDQSTAVADGLVDPGATTIVDRITFTQPGAAIHDPLYTNPSEYDNAGALLADKFMHYFTPDGGTTWYSMPEFAAMSVRCGGSFTLLPGYACIDFAATADPLLLEQEWAAFKGIYLGEKYRIQKRLMDNAVSTCGCAGVNWCIGSENEENYSWQGRMHSFPAPYDFWQDWYGMLGHQNCQPCNHWTYGYYDEKVRRFAEPSQFGNNNSSMQEAAYQGYMATGLCPMASAWHALFQEMAIADVLDQHGLDLSTLSGYQTVFLVANNYAPPTQTPADLVDQTYLSNTQVEFNIGFADGSAPCQVTLSTSVSDPYSNFWDDIVQVLDMDVQSNNWFTLHVRYQRTDQQIVQGTVTGTMGDCFNLHDCNFPQSCSTNDLGYALEDWLGLLALNDGSPEHLASTSQLDLSSQVMPGGAYDFQEVLMPRLRDPFGLSIPDLKWKWDNTQFIWYLGDGNTNNPPRWVIKVLGVSAVGAFDYTTQMDQVEFVEGLVSGGYNFFDVGIYDGNHDLLGTLHGQLFWEDADGLHDMAVGECAYPEPFGCTGPEYQVLDDLVAVLDDMLPGTGPDFDVDLGESPFMTDYLWSQLCPDCQPLDQNDDAPSGVKVMVKVKTITVPEPVGDCPAIQAPNVSFDSLGNPQLVGPPDLNGAYHQFTLTMYDNGVDVGTMTVYVPCVDIMECECVEDNGPIVADPSDDALLMSGLIGPDDIVDAYLGYKGAVEALNSAHGYSFGDAGYVELMSFRTFLDNRYDLPASAYIKFLLNYDPAIDDAAFTHDIELFIEKYGYATNVKEEYVRYLSAIDSYNARATAQGKPLLVQVDFDAFSGLLIAERVDEYVDYLRPRPLAGLTTKGLADWLSSAGGTGALDACEQIYVNFYLPAYLQFQDQQQDSTARCPKYAVYSPLYSIEEFQASNLCCSDSGLALLDAYIQSFYDTTTCPGELPLLKECLIDTMPDPKLFQLVVDPGCEKRYVIWRRTVDEFNQSEYAQTFGLMPDLYPDFRTWLRAGLCDCVGEYLDYLNEYILWKSGYPVPPPVMTIDEFPPCQVFIRPTEDECADAYWEYREGVADFRIWLDRMNIECNMLVALEEREFEAMDLCYCVQPFLQYLEYIQSDGVITQEECDGTNIYHFNCNPPEPCDPPVPQLTPIVTVPPENPCVEELLTNAAMNAQLEHQQQVAAFIQDLTAAYYSTCMLAQERFEMTFPDREHHFTLYYYDQAGNLVRTIPPEGVEQLGFTNCNDPVADAIENDRNNGTHTVFTEHRMPSDYVFNSLNNPIRQDMPDHDKMRIWETALPTGLPAWLHVTSSHFPGGGKGWLTGYRDLGSGLTRGYVYSSTDGGGTWTRVPGLVAADINKVHFPSTLVGYAVGKHGLLLKTVDGGSTWDMLTQLAAEGELLDVHFRNDQEGVVTGSAGQAWGTTDGFTSTTVVDINATGSERLEAVTYDAGAGVYWMAGTLSGGTNGYYAQVGQGPAFTLTAAPNAGSTTVDLTCVDDFTFSNAYAGGQRGVLLRTQTGGSSWRTMPTGTVDDFRDLFFVDNNHGVAIMDSAGQGVLRRTEDAGRTWVWCGTPALDLNDLHVYARTSTQVQAVAVGKNGQVVRVVAGTSAGIQMRPAPGTMELRSAYVLEQSGQLRCLVGDVDGNVHWCLDLMAGNVQWEDQVVFNGTEDVVAIAGYKGPGNNSINAVLLDDTGRKREGNLTTVSGGTWTWGGLPSAALYDAATARAPGHAVLYNRVSDQVEVLRLDNGPPPFQQFATTNSGSAPLATVRTIITMGASDDQVITVGNAGSIHTGGSLAATCAWNDRKWTVEPLPVRDLSEGEPIGAGDQGTFVRRTANGWEAIPTGRVENVSGLAYHGGQYMFVGDGKAHQVAINAPSSVQDMLLPQPLGLRDVTINTGVVHVAGDDGTVFHRPSVWTGAWNVLTYPSGNINGLAPRPGSGEVVAVGEHALMHRFFGTNRMVVNDLFTPRLNDIAFTPSGDGYAVGDGLTARHTANGGSYWNVVPQPQQNPPPALRGVAVKGPGHAYAVGNDGLAAEFTVAPGTGLDLWNDLPTSFGTNDLSDVAIAANGSAMLVGANAAGTAGCYAFRNADNPNWVLQTSPKPLRAVWSFEPFWTTGGLLNDFLFIGDQSFGVAWAQLMTFNSGIYLGANQQVNLTGLTGNVQALFFHDHVAGYAVTDKGEVRRTDKTTTPDHSTFAWDPDALNTQDYLDGQVNNTLMDIRTIGFSDRHHGFLGGCYDCSANATNPPVRYARTLTDESELYSSRFWYDKLGRIVLSQNTKQFNHTDGDPDTHEQQYSFTYYDNLGRIEKAGQVEDPGMDMDPAPGSQYFASSLHTALGADAQGQWQPFTIDPGQLRTWVDARQRTEVVQTHYDFALAGVPAQFSSGDQENLRLRVATSTYEDIDDDDDLTYQHATHYSYDIHGNVKELLQDIPQMGEDGCDMNGQMDNRFKRIEYSYDLISGNVLAVDYQDGMPDQFHHRYAYDADNRIEHVETSRNGINWREDARYFYYPHGPLQRVELGENKVQGLDYAYTLQGWLKGINSDLLTPENDMGNDALQVGGNPNALIGRDVYGLSLGYYRHFDTNISAWRDDYTAVDDSRWNTVTARAFAPEGGNMAAAGTHAHLFNGNIAHTVNTLAPFGGYPDAPTAPGQVLAMSYRYDQLNRLKEARGFVGLDTDNDWALAGTSTADLYKSLYNYDANGNFKDVDASTGGIQRWDQNGVRYDNLKYGYHANGDGLQRNRLYHVQEDEDPSDAIMNQADDGFEDYPHQPLVAQDLDNATNNVNVLNNYRYDELGNLERDNLEQIEHIRWTVAGKLKRVKHTGGTGEPTLLFHYGADGQRVVKEVQDNQAAPQTRDYYVRDAQGNIMALYRFDLNAVSFKVKERPMYGSSQVGVDNYELELCALDLALYDPLVDPPGDQRYQLTDHLGNVTNVLTDELLGVNTDGNTGYEYFQPQSVSSQGYEPFGSLLPGRNYSPSSYNYGFNGQLKDDEIYNAPGTSYTAEFWQYDPRTGRRWNLDPVFKPWQSSYATFSDNPIARIDPKGDDDFFNADGTFSHRTKTGHNIIIKTADGDVKFSAMRTNDLHNRQVMANVVGYYARQVGIDGIVGIRNHRSKNAREDGAMAFTLGNDIWVNARGGGVHSALDDYRNMKSALVHERIHKERGEGFENPDANPAFESYRHAKVYLAQMQDPTFADAQFKSGMIGSVVNYLNKAVGEMREDYDPATEMSGLIADFNKLSDVTGYKLHMTVTGVGNNPDSYTYKVSATPVTPPKTKKQ